MPGGTGIWSGRKAEARNVWMRSANRSNGNNAANVNTVGNCNGNNAYNGNRAAPDRAGRRTEGQHVVQQIREHNGTRSLPAAGATREQGGGDGRCPRAGRPTSAPGEDEEAAIGFEALWESMSKCSRGVMWKGSAASFRLNGLESVSKLADELADGTYSPRRTATFQVTSPKLRTITSTPFRDRVYQRSLNDNALFPAVSRSLVYDNAACQPGKGTDFARGRLKCHLQRHYRRHGTQGYVLHVDVRQYYASIPHRVGETVFDCVPEWARRRAVAVLRSQYSGERGYNPGSQMVQIIGIAALDGVDHFVKERLRVKGYVRYMDDLILVHESAERLEECLVAISEELARIELAVHPEKTRMRRVIDKTSFLGFDFRLTGSGKVVMTLRPESVKRMRRRISRLMALEARGLRPPGTAGEAYASWRAHAAKGDSRLLLEKCDRWYLSLKEEHMIDVGDARDPRSDKKREWLESKLEEQEAQIAYLALAADIDFEEEDGGDDE